MTTSLGNVFDELGFAPAGDAILKMRPALMSYLRGCIEKNNLTQAKAAARLGISRSRVSVLVRGKWNNFSLEVLVTLEASFGRKVSLKLAA